MKGDDPRTPFQIEIDDKFQDIPPCPSCGETTERIAGDGFINVGSDKLIPVACKKCATVLLLSTKAMAGF